MGRDDTVHGSRIIPGTTPPNALVSPFTPAVVGAPDGQPGVMLVTSDPKKPARLYFDLADDKLKVVCDGVTTTYSKDP